MKLFACCCKWKFVVGSKNVYGPIYPMGIGTYPNALSSGQRMMPREEFEENYSDCAGCYSGAHRHTVTLPNGHTTTCTCPGKEAA